MSNWQLPRIAFRELRNVSEARPTALITQPAAWAEVRKTLNLPLVVQAEPTQNTREYADYLAGTLPSAAQVVYVVGDGLPLDIGKMIARKAEKPLVYVPTALSSDQFLTGQATLAANAADGGKPEAALGAVPDEVVIDLALIQAAPAHTRAAAIVDVLSIVTALLDWNYAAQKSKTTPETAYMTWATGIAAGLAGQATKITPNLGRGEADALRTLVGLLTLAMQVDNLLGHRRASHGVEHLFADAAATIANIPHAEKVGPGILFALALHKRDAAGLRAALEAAGVRLNQLKPYEIRDTVDKLPDYAAAQDAPYTILNELKAGSPELRQALERSTLIETGANSTPAMS
jgi:glycerol dehydrogenase-like iron-containing ADH family enzyme